MVAVIWLSTCYSLKLLLKCSFFMIVICGSFDLAILRSWFCFVGGLVVALLYCFLFLFSCVVHWCSHEILFEGDHCVKKKKKKKLMKERNSEWPYVKEKIHMYIYVWVGGLGWGEHGHLLPPWFCPGWARSIMLFYRPILLFFPFLINKSFLNTDQEKKWHWLWMSYLSG